MARFPLRLKLLAALVALLALWASARAAESDKGVLADLISRALSSPSMSVSIGAVDGVLSSDASISDIVLSDRQGPWLRIDKVRLVWNRLALFSRRLEVDQLTIGRMQFLRRPLARRNPAAGQWRAAVHPARVAGQGDRQAIRGARSFRSASRSSGSRLASTFPARRRSDRRPRASTLRSPRSGSTRRATSRRCSPMFRLPTSSRST